MEELQQSIALIVVGVKRTMDKCNVIARDSIKFLTTLMRYEGDSVRLLVKIVVDGIVAGTDEILVSREGWTEIAMPIEGD